MERIGSNSSNNVLHLQVSLLDNHCTSVRHSLMFWFLKVEGGAPRSDRRADWHLLNSCLKTAAVTQKTLDRRGVGNKQ